MNLFCKMQALFCIVVLASTGCGNGGRSIGTISCDSTEPLYTGETTYYTFANGDDACMFGPSSEDCSPTPYSFGHAAPSSSAASMMTWRKLHRLKAEAERNLLTNPRWLTQANTKFFQVRS